MARKKNLIAFRLPDDAHEFWTAEAKRQDTTINRAIQAAVVTRARKKN